MVLFITDSGTLSSVVVSWTADIVAVVVSGLLLKVTLLPGGGSVSVWFFICRQFAGVSASCPFCSLMEFFIFRVQVLIV